MPYINVVVTAEPNAILSENIATRVTELTAAHLRKDPTITAVSVSYIDPCHWFTGGRSLAAQSRNTFWLDIKVVDGTNTKQEMASYLDNIFKAMSELLGDVHSESYALIHEVPAHAYGFEGKTQEFRFVAGRLSKAA
jgi:4-oxalocrotonate tautomerase